MAASKRSLPPLQRAVEFLRRKLTGQELVGVDGAGNRYYRWRERDPSDPTATVEKRRVRVPGGDILYDPRTLRPEWRQWLTRTRAEPPSEEELDRADARSAALAARVAAIEQREAARRFRAASLGQAGAGGADAGGPDLRAFTSQLEGRGFGGGGGGGGSSGGSGGESAPGSSSGAAAAARGPAEGTGGQSSGGGGGGGAAPDSSGGEPDHGAPSGSGETFKPGVWRPGG